MLRFSHYRLSKLEELEIHIRFSHYRLSKLEELEIHIKRYILFTTNRIIYLNMLIYFLKNTIGLSIKSFFFFSFFLETICARLV